MDEMFLFLFNFLNFYNFSDCSSVKKSPDSGYGVSEVRSSGRKTSEPDRLGMSKQQQKKSPKAPKEKKSDKKTKKM